MKSILMCSASLLAHLVVVQVATAQVAVDGVLPKATFTDANGVDLRTGQLLRTSAELSIGPVDNTALGYGILDTFRGVMASDTPLVVRLQMTQCQNGVSSPANGCFQELTAQIGTTSYNFGWEEGNPRTSRAGAKLDTVTGGYVMTVADGTKYYFDEINYDRGVGPVQTIARGGEIVRRNGERLTYVYAAGSPGLYGLRSITSNKGYQLRYDGNVNNFTVRLINLAVDYCAPAAATCSTTRNWPSVASSSSFSGSTLSGTLMDQSNRIYSYSSTNGVNSVLSPDGGLNYSFARSSFGQTPVGNTGAPRNIIATAWYEDSDGRTNYAYTVDKFARVTASSSSRASGAVQRFAIERDTPYVEGQISPGTYRFALTDPISRVTRIDVKKHVSSIGAYWPDEFDVSSIRYPEGNAVNISREAVHNRVTAVTLTPKTGETGSIIATGSYTDCLDWSLCVGPDATVDARNNQADFTYDPATGLIASRTAPADEDGVRARTRYAYRQVQAVYKNGSGALVPSGSPVWKLDYTSTCRAATECTGTANETRVVFGYDGNLSPTTETTMAGDGSLSSTVTRTYDAVGNVTSIDGPLPGADDTTYFFYDDARQLIGQIGPDPDGPGGALPRAAVRNTYDKDGFLTVVRTGSATGTTLSDLQNMTVLEEATSIYEHGKKMGERRSTGGTIRTVTDFAYDSDGRLVCTAVRMNRDQFSMIVRDACALGVEGADGPDRITKNTYDDAGQLKTVTKAFRTPLEQAYVQYTYTDNGKQQIVKDANLNTAQMEYDKYDRVRRWRLPSKASDGTVSTSDYEEYSYDNNANRTSLRRRDGRTLTFGYDALNRMTSKIIPDGCWPARATGCPDAAATRDVYYGYDLGGRRLFARFGSKTGDGITSEYDALGRLASSTTNMEGVSRTLGYKYDEAGNRKRITHPDGIYFSTEYDNASRLKTASWWSPAVGVYPFLTVTYDAFARLSDVARGASATGYDYDALSRLIGQSQRFNGNVGNLSAGFGYNPANQINSRSLDSDAFVYAGYSNASRSYAVNGLNQYISAGSDAPQYDANGNLTAANGTTYVYDGENRLVAASNGTKLIYDPLGRLWKVSGGPSGTTQFLYDGDALVAEYSSSGNLLRRYMHGSSVDEPLLVDEGSSLNCSGTRFLNADHQGSIVATADCSGARMATNAYDEYGNPRSDIGRFQYTGQAWLSDLSLYYYKSRLYSPKMGRFLQVDPVGYDDQVNLYAYVGNDPVNGRDPMGLYICDANPSQCKSVQQGIDRIADAAKQYRSGSSEAKALNSIVSAYGKQGVDNGVTVNVARLGNEILGQTSGDKNGVKISLDFGNINKTGGLDQGAVTLAHEGVHGIERLAGRDPVDNRGVTREEFMAYHAGALVSGASGFTNPVGPNMSSATFSADVRDAARKDCVFSGIREEMNNPNHQSTLPGPCH